MLKISIKSVRLKWVSWCTYLQKELSKKRYHNPCFLRYISFTLKKEDGQCKIMIFKIPPHSLFEVGRTYLDRADFFRLGLKYLSIKNRLIMVLSRCNLGLISLFETSFYKWIYPQIQTRISDILNNNIIISIHHTHNELCIVEILTDEK